MGLWFLPALHRSLNSGVAVLALAARLACSGLSYMKPGPNRYNRVGIFRVEYTPFMYLMGSNYPSTTSPQTDNHKSPKP